MSVHAILVHGDVTYAAPASQGGTGKTQLAVAFCHALLDHRAVEVLVWVDAVSREAVVSGFAQAGGLVRLATPDGNGGRAAVDAGRIVPGFWLTGAASGTVDDAPADSADLSALWQDAMGGRDLITPGLPAACVADAAELVRAV